MTLSADSEKLTRGHKKKARTRQQLLDAALKIYAHKGAGELALNELAQEAGVSNGTVYNYFRTKEDVLEAVSLAQAEALSHEVALISTGVADGAERVAIGIRAFVLRAASNPEWASALINIVRYAEGMRSALGDYVRSDIRAGLKQGQFDYTDEEMAVSLLVSGVISVMIAIVEGRYQAGNDRVIAAMLLQALGMKREQALLVAEKALPVVEKRDD
ncbi:TetR/AcrR family transcriptional regulator [Thalassolituus sp. LLYu03]|uniref:TetR/AcrR family transcriptional regulator n=1 Tax=Thalassolituus sp. LLYu03 TaxID=3421656 RepID=UPI003D2CFC8B